MTIKALKKPAPFYLFILFLLLLSLERPLYASENKLGIFISGLYGNNKEFKAYMEEAAARFFRMLVASGYSGQNLIRFAESSSTGRGSVHVSTREELRQFFESITQADKSYDEVFLFLTGHTNGKDGSAKLHLPGPDITYDELIRWVDGISAKRMMVVVAAPQGTVWVERLSRPGRILLIANGLREFDVLPIHFLRFFLAENRETSVPLFDIFANAQSRTQIWYRENDLYPTELAMLDADGDQKADSLIQEIQESVTENGRRIFQVRFNDAAGDARAAQSIVLKSGSLP